MAHYIPLAERLRPKKLSEIIGQEHLTTPNAPIYRQIQSGQLNSMILWGPPGVGKTTLAQILGKELKHTFFKLSAISSGIKEVREVIQKAKKQQNTILFIDEIHRFNKSQQDALLGAVENGDIILIGATTENPSFEVNAALLSRTHVYQLKKLEKSALLKILNHAIETDSLFEKIKVEIHEEDALFHFANGDGRKLLNLLELAAKSVQESETLKITNQLISDLAVRKMSMYDKSGEQHYDIISAFIKSIRGSDPNAAVYWLARMLDGGEDAKFIARRLLISASEDIGNANPTALVLATNCFQAVNFIGLPEAEIILSQTTVYLASSPKSNASYKAIKEARSFVRKNQNLEVPLHLRNAPTKLMKNMNYGQNYLYAHDFENNFVEQEFLPEEISGKRFYEPGDNPRENEFRKRLKRFWKDKYNY